MTTRYFVISDLSGEPEAEPVRLGFEGKWYELDATTSERADLEKMLRPYLRVGRQATASSGVRTVPPMRPRDRAAIRMWARSRGFAITDRGRIPYRIWVAYEKANAAGR